MRVRERFGRPFPVAVGQWWARFWLVGGSLRMGARGRRSRAVTGGADRSDRYFRRPGMFNLIWVEAPGPAASRWGPAVARTHDGRDSRGLCRFLWASRGPVAGVESFLDVLAGDLVAAGNAVGVGSRVCSGRRWSAGHARCARRSPRLRRAGAGGQPQRQRSMTQVVGTQACRARYGRGAAGQVPDPAVAAHRPRAGPADQREAPPLPPPGPGQHPRPRHGDHLTAPGLPGAQGPRWPGALGSSLPLAPALTLGRAAEDEVKAGRMTIDGATRPAPRLPACSASRTTPCRLDPRNLVLDCLVQSAVSMGACRVSR
jgi:hypothetical protein